MLRPRPNKPDHGEGERLGYDGNSHSRQKESKATLNVRAEDLLYEVSCRVQGKLPQPNLIRPWASGPLAQPHTLLKHLPFVGVLAEELGGRTGQLEDHAVTPRVAGV